MSIWNKLMKPREGWMGDSESSACLLCGNEFSFAIRRHHCRACYRLVCGSCSNHNIELDGDRQLHRICDDCYDKLGTAGLVGQGFNASSVNDISVKITIHSAMYLPPAHENGFIQLSEHSPVRNAVCTLSIGDKIVKTTSLQSSLNPVWNESLELKINMTSPLESFLVAEIWDKGRKINGDELVCRCRIPLTRLYFQHEINEWYILVDQDGRGTSKLHLALTRSINPPGPQRAPELPLYEIDIPYGIDLSLLSPAIRSLRSFPVVQIFPPTSVLHKHLFYPNIQKSIKSQAISDCSVKYEAIVNDAGLAGNSQSTDSSVPSEILNPFAFIPCNELYVEGLDNIWLAMENESSHVNYIHGTFLLTTHRLLFIQRTSNKISTYQQNIPNNTNNHTHRHHYISSNHIITISIMNVQIINIKRRYKDKYNALEICCYDNVNYILISERSDNELRILEAFRRIKDEISWYNDNLAFEHNLSNMNNNTHKLYYYGSPHKLAIPIYSNNIQYKSDIDNCSAKLFDDMIFTNFHSHRFPQCKNNIDGNAKIKVDYSVSMRNDENILEQIKLPYDIDEDYNRMLPQNSTLWRISHCNEKYRMCRTYPESLIVPAPVSDNHLKIASTQRSGRRLPVLTWIHPVNGASLCRSSQPNMGISTVSACVEDEQLLICIRQCTQFYELDKSTHSSPELNISTWNMDIGNVKSTTSSNSIASMQQVPDLRVSPTMNVGNRPDDMWTEVIPQRNADTLTDIRATDDSAAGNIPTLTSSDSAELPNKSTENHDEIEILSRDLQENPNAILRIIDLRPFINAKGNALMGKGHEVVARLGGPQSTTLEFLGIANIHVMRDSYGAMRQAGTNSTNVNYLQAINDSKWLFHISQIIKASIRVATYLAQGDPVLVHCSDGWDRTSQICALSQLLLDPFYRTILGLKCLLAKDFHSFGHKFRCRTSHNDPHNRSPVFIQLIDCIWQIWRQMPHEFEYNEELLILLVYMANSRYTDDFVFDSAREQDRARLLMKKVYSQICCKSCALRKNCATDVTLDTTSKIDEVTSNNHPNVKQRIDRVESLPNSSIHVANVSTKTALSRSISDTNEIIKKTHTIGLHKDQLSNSINASKSDIDLKSFINYDMRNSFDTKNDYQRSANEEANRNSNVESFDMLCEECENYAQYCLNSLWTYVSDHILEFINPVYFPSLSSPHPNNETESKENVPYPSGALSGDIHTNMSISNQPKIIKSVHDVNWPSSHVNGVYVLHHGKHVLSSLGHCEGGQNGKLEHDSTCNMENVFDSTSMTFSGNDENNIDVNEQIPIVENIGAEEDSYDFLVDCESGGDEDDDHDEFDDLNVKNSNTNSLQSAPVAMGESSKDMVTPDICKNDLNSMTSDKSDNLFMRSNTDLPDSKPSDRTETDSFQRDVFLLKPKGDIQALAIWETVYFSGIVMLRSIGGSSSIYTRALEASLQEQLSHNKELEQKIKNLESMLANKK